MKKLKKVISFLLASVMIMSLFMLGGTASAAADPMIEADAALLVEVKSGEVLYSKNADEVRAPASTTKIMTVLLAVEAMERNEITETDTVLISDEALEGLPADASNAELTAGEEMSFLNLLYCAAVYSANDACNAIAEHISGNVSDFVKLMNERAAELGCENTQFKNPHGLQAEGHHTTAHDLYLMLKEGYTHEMFVKLMGTSSYTVPSTNAHIQRSLSNTNKLLSKDSEYYYQNVLCGKTGYTEQAGYCLAAIGSDSKLDVISVIMGADYATTDNGSKVYQHYSETRRLMEWGFNNYSYRAILDEADLLKEVPVLMGEGTESVVLRPEKSIYMLTENEVSTENDVTYDITVYSEQTDEDLVAPIKSGDVLGEVNVLYKGESQGTVKLVANSSVTLLRSEYLKSEFSKGMSNGWIRATIFFMILVVGLYIAYLVYYNRVLKYRNGSVAVSADSAVNSDTKSQKTTASAGAKNGSSNK